LQEGVLTALRFVSIRRQMGFPERSQAAARLGGIR